MNYYRESPDLASPSQPTPRYNLIVCLHPHSNSDQPSFRDEGALFCALGWHVTTSETLR